MSIENLDVFRFSSVSLSRDLFVKGCGFVAHVRSIDILEMNVHPKN